MISLDQCYQNNAGRILDVDGIPADAGQCVQWADVALNQVYGLPYHIGNAIDWWNNPGELLDNFDKISNGTVLKGDFVVFNEQVGSIFGHIDIAMQNGTFNNFLGADSNWGGNLTVHTVTHTNPNYILGCLRYKGGNMTPILSNDDAQVLYMGWLPVLTESSDYTAAKDSFASAWTGKNLDDCLNYLQTNEDIQNFRTSLINGGSTPTVVVNGVTYVPS